jgi:hypothetical protein
MKSEAGQYPFPAVSQPVTIGVSHNLSRGLIEYPKKCIY